MPFRQQFGQLFNEVKDKVEQYQKDREASQQQAYPSQQQSQQSQQQHQHLQQPFQRPHQEQQHTGHPPSPPSYWRPVFDPRGSVSSDFKHELGDWGWGNNELQNYTADARNSFYTPDNKLVLRAIADSHAPDRQKHTSARLRSQQRLDRQRGCLIAVVTPPSARGVWPALWLLPTEPFQWPGDGEVDIVESWNGDQVNHCNLHWGQFNGEDWNKHRVVTVPLPDLARRQSHFAFAWEQPENGKGGMMVWYVNGAPVMKAGIPDGTRRMSDWQIIINVAMGGNVNGGVTPADGTYDFVVHSLMLCDEPPGGWDKFGGDCHATAEGNTM